ISLRPAPDGGVMHRQAAFRHQLLDIPKTQRKPQIPTDAGHDHGRLEPALPEQWWPRGFHTANLSDRQMQHFLSMDYQQPSSVARVTLIRLSDIRSRASLRRRQTLNPGVPEKTLVVVRETSCWQLEILRLPWPLPLFLSA